MKRYFIILLSLSLLVLTTVGTAMGNQGVDVIVDGKKLNLDAPTLIENGRVLVPLRAIFNALDAEVNYNEVNGIIWAKRYDTVITLKMGSKDAYVNNTHRFLDVPAKSINGHTMIPLRFVSEAIDAKVTYENNVISITKSKEPVKVHFIDLGSGEAIFIQIMDKSILIDGGDWDNVSKLTSFLRDQRIKEIDLLISTQPSEENMGGLPTILKQFKVKRLIDSGKISSGDSYLKYKESAIKQQEKGMVWETVREQEINIYDTKLQILTKYQDNIKESFKSASVVSRFTVGNVGFLFMGDVEGNKEQMINYQGPAQIIKIANHGGEYSTSESLLKSVKPQVAIIFVGEANKDLLPSQKTLERIIISGAKIYRTDLNGTVTITTNGKEYSLATEYNNLPAMNSSKKEAHPPVDFGLYVGDIKKQMFHLPGCSEAKKIKVDDKAWFTSIDHAKENNYLPHSICIPNR